MSTFETLHRQLQLYKNLQFHFSREIAAKTVYVQRWQILRMKAMHAELFEQPQNQALVNFLLNRLYSLRDMKVLAYQIKKALNEQVSLDRFLPASVREAAEIGFQLACITISLDEEIAIYCMEHGHERLTEEILRVASLELNHFQMRNKQLMMLARLAEILQSFGKSFLIQSAFKLAKRPAYSRGFAQLYDYMDEGFRAVKATPQARQFFESFISQEKLLVLRVHEGHPTPIQSLLKTEQTPV